MEITKEEMDRIRLKVLSDIRTVLEASDPKEIRKRLDSIIRNLEADRLALENPVAGDAHRRLVPEDR